MTRAPVAAIFLSLIAGCADASTDGTDAGAVSAVSASASSLVASTSGSASADAAAALGLVVAPSTKAELDKVSTCYAAQAEKKAAGCEKEENAFMRWASAQAGGADGDLGAATQRRGAVIESLLASMTDPSLHVRDAAVSMLSLVVGRIGVNEAWQKDRRATQLLLQRMAAEKEARVASQTVWLMSSFDVTDDDRNSVVAWVKSIPQEKERIRAGNAAFAMLTPPKGAEPIDGAVDLALARVVSGSGLGRAPALELLSRAKRRAADVCPTLKLVIDAHEKDQFWLDATDAAAALGEPCQAAVAAGVEATAAALKEDDVAVLSVVVRLVGRPGVSAEQKKTLAQAVSPKTKAGPFKDDAEAIVEAAKKP